MARSARPSRVCAVLPGSTCFRIPPQRGVFSPAIILSHICNAGARRTRPHPRARQRKGRRPKTLPGRVDRRLSSPVSASGERSLTIGGGRRSLRAMKYVIAAILLTSLAGAALASNRAHVSASEMANAITEVANTPVYRYGPKPIRPADIRVLKCVGPDEEPTEFECVWERRAAGRWVRYKTWLAIDGKGWQVID